MLSASNSKFKIKNSKLTDNTTTIFGIVGEQIFAFVKYGTDGLYIGYRPFGLCKGKRKGAA